MHRQHDAGEFLQRFLAVAQPGACAGGWEARLTNPSRVHDSGDLGIPLLLHLPGETLQTLVDSWHNQFATHALTYHGGDLFLQICRFCDSAQKNMQCLPLRPGDVVAMPVFTEVGSACTRLEQFRVVAAVFHLGPRTTSGHYQALLGKPEAGQCVSYICDDNRKPRRAQSRDLDVVDHNAYLVGLLRCPQHWPRGNRGPRCHDPCCAATELETTCCLSRAKNPCMNLPSTSISQLDAFPVYFKLSVDNVVESY